MKAQFIVTIDGNWLENGKPTTHAKVEKSLREAVKDEFQFLADRATVKRLKVSAKTATAEPKGGEQ